MALQGGEEIAIGDVRIDVQRKAPEGLVRAPAKERPEDEEAAAEAGAPPVPTYSMVGRMIDSGTRRARRTAIAVGVVAMAAVLTLGALLVTGRLGGGEGAVPKVVAALSPATVLIETFHGQSRAGTGSGWVLDAQEGLIVTNAHVINQGQRFTVAIAGTKPRPATVAAVAPCEDLALLRVTDRQRLVGAPLGTGASVRQGETVVALGYGADARPGESVGSTTGVVSVASTSFRDPAADVPAYPAVVQTDTALNPGNSGGLLADLDGRVIGINSAARTSGADGRPLQNVNYAIAIDHAKPILELLRQGRSLGWTGLTFGYPSDRELADAGLSAGLRITGAIPGTAAAKSGIGETDALLAGIDGKRIGTSLSSYCEAASELKSGSTATLAFADPGASRTRDVEIAIP